MGSRLFFVSIQNGIIASVCWSKQGKFHSEELNNAKWNWYPSNQYVYWTFSNEPWCFFFQTIQYELRNKLCVRRWYSLLECTNPIASGTSFTILFYLITPYSGLILKESKLYLIQCYVEVSLIIDFFSFENYFNEHSKKIYNTSKL